MDRASFSPTLPGKTIYLRSGLSSGTRTGTPGNAGPATMARFIRNPFEAISWEVMPPLPTNKCRGGPDLPADGYQ